MAESDDMLSLLVKCEVVQGVLLTIDILIAYQFAARCRIIRDCDLKLRLSWMQPSKELGSVSPQEQSVVSRRMIILFWLNLRSAGSRSGVLCSFFFRSSLSIHWSYVFASAVLGTIS